MFVQNMLNQPKYQGWTFDDTRDLDGDNVVDSVIYDPQHQPVYFNGYYNIPNERTITKKDYYHDPAYQAQNWDNESFKEFRKTPYEILLIRVAKEFRARLKQGLEVQRINPETISRTMKDISGDFVKKFINKYIIIPLLIRSGTIGNIGIDQYAQTLTQTINQRDIQNHALMALFRQAKRIMAGLTEQQLTPFIEVLDAYFRQPETVAQLFNHYSQHFDARTNTYPKAAKINFGIGFMRAVINGINARNQAPAPAPAAQA